jgi:hypothetical protein
VKKLIRLMLVLVVFLSSAGLDPAHAGRSLPLDDDDPPVPHLLEGFPYTVRLPLIINQPGYTVSGKVSNAAGQPMSGVTLTGSNGETAVTNTSGQYNLQVGGGQASLAPAKDGFMFSPAMVEVNVNTNLSGQNFTAVSDYVETIVNGGFESTTWWDLVGGGYPSAYTNALAHEGLRAMRLGIVNAWENSLSESRIRTPSITIPGGVTEAALRLWLYPVSTEAPAAIKAHAPEIDSAFGDMTLLYDAQYVRVLDASNNVIGTLLYIRSNNASWGVHQFDLRPFAGRTIKLEIGVYNDGSDGVTSLYADDVSLRVSSSATPPPTPPADICANQVANSSFEYNGSWNLPSTNYPAGYSYDYAFSGVRSMRTGIPLTTYSNIESYSDAWQTVYIPPGATNAKLKMRLYPRSEEVYPSAAATEAGAAPADDATATPPADAALATPQPNTDPTETPPTVDDGAAPPQPDADPTAAPAAADEPTPAPGIAPPREGTIWNDETLSPDGTDTQYVLLLDPNTGAILRYLEWWTPYSSAYGWVYREYDLSAYAGQYVRIQFGTYNNGYGGRSVMYADDVQVTVCNTEPPPPVCSERISNGGFENNSAWYVPYTAFSAGYSTWLRRSGVRSMRSGIVYWYHNRYAYSDFRQTVTIPAGTRNATLNFYAYSMSGEAYAGVAASERPTAGDLGAEAMSGDVQYLLVLDRYGNWIDTLMWRRSNESYWRNFQYNLNRYIGSTIILQWGTFNNGYSGVTSMYVDDVSLQVCP